MSYSLYSTDGRGDSGSVSCVYWLDEAGTLQTEHNAKPRVGVSIRVGSMTGRSYSNQDWWQTSLITEILEETEETAKFKTGNSTDTR